MNTPKTIKLDYMANMLSDSAYESLLETTQKEVEHLYGKRFTDAGIIVTVEVIDPVWEK